ncbi:MAG TPA: hypothetical protein EYN89_05555 [Flavobacteriales bacterium]|nr:hypothetical protein [Flavobacteriales bacterium]
MKYSDLHRHLDGSIRMGTLVDLADNLGIGLPEDPQEITFFKGMGLEAALSRFAITLSVLQQPAAVRRVADEICQDAQREGLHVLEIRFAPQLHKGGSVEEVVDSALEGIQGRAGLILCGLYGESPAVFEQLVEIAIPRKGVVGLDLAGAPSPSHKFGMLDYADAYHNARDHGIGRTVHASEGRSVEEIRWAIESLHAQRIGHGTTLLEDHQIVDLVLEKEVLIEANVTSNVDIGAVECHAEHPIAKWLKLGVKVAICTDNTLLSQVDAPTEYERISQIPEMTPDMMSLCEANGLNGRFLR